MSRSSVAPFLVGKIVAAVFARASLSAHGCGQGDVSLFFLQEVSCRKCTATVSVARCNSQVCSM